MNGIVLQIVCYVAALASFAPWPETSAESSPRTTISTIPSTTTFNPKGTPCEDVRCPSGRHCAVDENNEAVCVCDAHCDDDIYFPVCGSDNKTYPNVCAVIRKACATNSNLTLGYYGVCTYEGSVCNGFTCPLNRVCAVAGKRAICVCDDNCPTYINRFCGSDNQTYNNDCELQKQSCLTNKTITKAYYGDCKLETPCDGFSCPTGMKCAIYERKGPVCVCLDKCPYVNDMVCGTDGRTYTSECEVYRQACITVTSLRVAYNGHCLNGSVCFGYRCPKNKQCNVNEDNNQPVCVCSQSCPSENDQVCGSDGVTYQNLCSLEKQACTTGTNLTMVRKGLCIRDAFCNGVVCPNPKTCVVNERNQTSCVCNNDCGDVYSPVCGSDYKTYDNYCWFVYAACQGNLSTNYYMGVCAEGPNCEGIYCPTGQHCDSMHQPKPKCVCNTVCPKTYSPVCGSNNKTYSNLCELQKAACLTNVSIDTSFNGRCEDGPGCIGTYCSNGRACAVDERNRPMCVCSQSCATEPNEVCGSDGKTYSSECLLRAAACMTNKTIEVQRYEPCKKESACHGVACSSEKHCEVAQDGKRICVCNDQCTSYSSNVCGSDNKTYNSLCELQKKACISSPSISWLYNGACVVASVCDKFSCPPDKRCAVDEKYQPTCVCFDDCVAVQDPVCGSDGLTYSNKCEMQKSACIANRNVTMKYRGKCDKGLTCGDVTCPTGRVCAMTEKNQTTCVCDTVCSPVDFHIQVCGTDGKTYTDICYLMREACTKNENIQRDYYGPCKSESASSTTTGRLCVGPSCTTERTEQQLL